LKVISELFTR